MINDIKKILHKLNLPAEGRYDNHFYIIDLDNSDEYAKVYTKLNKNAVNTEYPNFETNTNNSTTKVTNYFEIEAENLKYNIFLIANFTDDKYYVKIGAV